MRRRPDHGPALGPGRPHLATLPGARPGTPVPAPLRVVRPATSVAPPRTAAAHVAPPRDCGARNDLRLWVVSAPLVGRSAAVNGISVDNDGELRLPWAFKPKSLRGMRCGVVVARGPASRTALCAELVNASPYRVTVEPDRRIEGSGGRQAGRSRTTRGRGCVRDARPRRGRPPPRGRARVLRDAALAEDATQQALLAIWRDLPRLRDPGRFEAWCYRVVVRACHAEGRRERQRIPAGTCRRAMTSPPPCEDYRTGGRSRRARTGVPPAVDRSSRRGGAPPLPGPCRSSTSPGSSGCRLAPFGPDCTTRCARCERRSTRTPPGAARGFPMNTDPELQRAVRGWLSEGPTTMPEHVLGSVLADVVTTPASPASRTWEVCQHVPAAASCGGARRPRSSRGRRHSAVARSQRGRSRGNAAAVDTGIGRTICGCGGESDGVLERVSRECTATHGVPADSDEIRAHRQPGDRRLHHVWRQPGRTGEVGRSGPSGPDHVRTLPARGSSDSALWCAAGSRTPHPRSASGQLHGRDDEQALHVARRRIRGDARRREGPHADRRGERFTVGDRAGHGPHRLGDARFVWAGLEAAPARHIGGILADDDDSLRSITVESGEAGWSAPLPAAAGPARLQPRTAAL